MYSMQIKLIIILKYICIVIESKWILYEIKIELFEANSTYLRTLCLQFKIIIIRIKRGVYVLMGNKSLIYFQLKNKYLAYL